MALKLPPITVIVWLWIIAALLLRNKPRTDYNINQYADLDTSEIFFSF